MVEMLENNSGKPVPEEKEKETKIKELEERNSKLQQELESRAVKGDFNPEETMVLHMANNPMQQAVQKRELEIQEMKDERDALRTRVQLLEEGQTKDLTLMVGKKMEEGESSEEISHMKEELEKAELRKQRLMEAFTSLMHNIPLGAERIHRIRFRDNFDKFIVNVRGFLFVK